MSFKLNKPLINTALLAALITAFIPSKTFACGGDAYIGEVCTVGFNFAPRGTALTQGQLLPIAQFTALFSLLGTTYGGDGRTTFALPDTRGRSIVGAGRGPGLQDIRWGQKGGSETVVLQTFNMPAHDHGVQVQISTTNDTSGSSAILKALAARSTTTDPTGAVLSNAPRRSEQFSNAIPNVDMSADSIVLNLDVESSHNVTVNEQSVGTGQPVNIRDPYIGMYQVIVLNGIFPSRS